MSVDQPEASRPDHRPTHGSVAEQPWCEDWSNVVARREEGTDQVSEYTLKKRKSRHLAQERDISRGRAAHLLKHGDATVPDEVVR